MVLHYQREIAIIKKTLFVYYWRKYQNCDKVVNMAKNAVELKDEKKISGGGNLFNILWMLHFVCTSFSLGYQIFDYLINYILFFFLNLKLFSVNVKVSHLTYDIFSYLIYTKQLFFSISLKINSLSGLFIYLT